MLNYLSRIVPMVLILLGVQAMAQVNHPLSEAFTTAISRGDANGLSALLDDELEFVHEGKTGTFRKQVVAGKLNDFFRINPPLSFLMKHQGSSADGQLYAIGQLTTQSGSHYKVLLRAKPAGNQFRIIKLDLLQNQ